MTSFKEQLGWLLWKNWILRKRHKTRALMEFLWPLILFVILMWVRTRGLKTNRPNCHLVEKTLPSVGGVEFIQNFICTLNNTCYDDYIENQGNKVFERSLFSMIIKESSPPLKAILATQKGVDTVSMLWDDITSYIQIVSAFQSRSEQAKIGKVMLKELMGAKSKSAFIKVIPTYTTLDSDKARELLESKINLDEVNRNSVANLLETFKDSDCVKKLSSVAAIEFISNALVQELCTLSRQETFLLTFLISNHLDRDKLIKKLSGKDPDVLSDLDKGRKVNKLIDYDISTLENLGKLGRVFGKYGSMIGKFPNMSSADLASTVIYEGLCGMERKQGNSSVFGFDPGNPSRFDSLRDRLREWNPDHHYEVDPEISSTCNSMFQRLEATPFTALLWRQLKPFIRGVIYYSPDTPFTNDVMKKVDEKFGELREIETGVGSVLNILHRTRKWLRTNSDDLNHTLIAVMNKDTVEMVLQALDVKTTQLELARITKMAEEIGSQDIEKTLERIDFMSELLSEVMGCIKYNKSQPFETEWEAVNAGSKLLSAEKLWAVVIFEGFSEANGNISAEEEVIPKHIKYKIRMDSDKVDGTRIARDRLTSKTPRRRPTFDMKYVTNGFVYLQEMIEHSIIELVTGKSTQNITSYLQQFPYPCHIMDQFIRAVSRTFPLFMVLSWVYASSMIVKSVVMEKELRLKEVMKVMGLSNGVIWCGWFIDSFSVMAVSATMLTAILKYGKVIEHSDVSLIWVFMISYTVATINFSFLVSTFFSRANSAAAAGGILFFISYLPYNMLLIWEEQLSWYQTLSSCFISNVAFGFGCTYFARYEEDGVGAQWSRISLSSLPGDDFNLGYCILMLWFDSVLYWFLTWYIEAVFPGSTGVPKPWNFFMKRSYWKGRTAPRGPTKVLYENVPGCSTPNLTEEPVVEPEPEGVQCGVAVKSLSKTYSNGKVALTDLTINFYESQITSFLGHNGAGKTTTISILTGLFPPSSGTARVYGLDIYKDMDSIRTGTGICPQYNTLFDRLNVEEHMKFYAGLKGKYDDSFEKEFSQMISDLGIPHKRYEFPSNLSGGMKRKLSVACSFIGGSKTVFLDEPTSGVDPYSRRSIWELLLKYKQGRTIILTTHYMDEADLLGDRIAIISQGKLKACGSSLFLKSHFGQGYYLRLVRDDPLLLPTGKSAAQELKEELPLTEIKVGNSSPNMKQPESISNFLRTFIPNSKLTDDVGSELVFLLPYDSLQLFPQLFASLDSQLHELGISSYGISDTTLEDVFLKITIEDIEANADSFHSLSSSCKRRVMEMLRKLKRRKKMNVFPERVVTLISEPPVDNTVITSNGNVATDVDVTVCEGPATNNRVLDMEGNTVVVHSIVVPNLQNQCPSEIDTVNASLLEEAFIEDEFPVRRNADRNLCCLALIQIYMIYLKRLWNSNRNKKALFFEIILPAVFIAITLAFTLILPPATDEPPRELSPWTYPSPNLIFFSKPVDKPTEDPLFAQFTDGLLGHVGMGTACVKDEYQRGLCDPGIWSAKRITQFEEARNKYNGSKFDSCSCSHGSLQCPSTVDKVKLPSLKSPSRDNIQDASKINIPEWIEKTYRTYETSRYGGFELQLRDPPLTSVSDFVELIDQFTKMMPSIIEDDDSFFEDDDSKEPKIPVFKVWYENRGWVTSVAYLNALHNILLRENLPQNLTDAKDEFGITVTSHPMNLTKSQSNKESLKTAGLGVIHAVCVIFALSFVPASFTVYLIEERKCGGKHLHLVSGVKPITYWVANFLYDLGKYCIPTALCVVLFILFDAKAYIGSPSIYSFICLLLLYGWASIPAMYPFSFLFSIPSTAFVVLACMNLFIGVVSTVSTFVLEQFGDPELEAIGDILKQVFLVFPHYCLGRGLMELVRLDMEAIAYDKLAIHMTPKDRFHWENLGKMLFFLALHGIIFFTLTLCFEYRQLFYFIFKKLYTPKKAKIIGDEPEDEDVIKEKNRVIDNPDMDSTLRAENLTKCYAGKKNPAVNGLTFAIERGECFGLLGINGAGKSSSFKMLTGDVRITSGRAKICGSDVETNLDSARQHFGYCPQEDGLDPLLDAYEVLNLYGRLRGMSVKDAKLAVEKLIQTIGLKRCAKRRCGTYSGGNRRKLSTAIALIGDPDIVFLDEPTSGMDPASRRKFWKVILRLTRIGKSVVLTSHSMEECEALCSRIAIMVNGQFMCLGSLQHLKNRFGDGYTVTVRCSKPFQEEFRGKIVEDIPSVRLEDCHCSQLKFAIPQKNAALSEIFNVMCKFKDLGLIEDYSVSQTTLDDIFVKFASQQKDDMDR